MRMKITEQSVHGEKADSAMIRMVPDLRYLLLKNEETLSEKQQYHLQDILELNATLNALYVLKGHLKLVYYYSDQ